MANASRAVNLLVCDGVQPSDADTVTIGSQVYTFKTTLTNTAGFVKIGATVPETLANLKAAINRATGFGTIYANATLVHPSVVAGAIVGNTLALAAKVPGDAGNHIPVAKSATHLSFTTTTNFLGGNGDLAADLQGILSGEQLNAGVVEKLTRILDPNRTGL